MDPISFTYAPGEYARALRRYRVHAYHVVRDSLVALLLLGLAALTWEVGWSARLLAGAACAYLAIAAVSAWVWPVLAGRHRRQLREPYTLAFSDDGIAFTTPSIDSRLPWSVYRSWWIDPDFIVLALGRGHGTVLPRRAIPPADDEALRSLLERRLGPARNASRGRLA